MTRTLPDRSRAYALAIGCVLAAELVVMPWTAHAFDTVAFLSHADRVFFLHVSPRDWWAFGSISLIAVLLSQLPIALFPELWNAMPLRILLLKLPYWISDLGTAAIIKLCSEQESGLWALRYLLDPAVFFCTVFHGQQDALPNFFAVAGIALILKEKYELAGVVLGLGAGTKFYPAAFIPLLLVVAMRRSSWRRAALSFLGFACAVAATLLPTVWGREESFYASYTTNSFGEASRVLAPSVWSLLPAHLLSPQIEQLVAMIVPIALVLPLLRKMPDRIDIARTAMLSALAIVVLNPAAHQPFFVWVAGPLVLYAAVEGNGLVSLAGALLSVLSVFVQFCQEGSDEYFLFNFGSTSGGLLRCVGPPLAIVAALVVSALFVGIASFLPSRLVRRPGPRVYAILVVVTFGVTFLAATAGVIGSAVARHAHGPQRYWDVLHARSMLAISPKVEPFEGGCRLTYSQGDVVSFAGNPYAAQFVTAYLGYTLFAPETLTIRGRDVPVQGLPPSYSDLDLVSMGQGPIRITREFDVTPMLRPYRQAEVFEERPCTLIPGTPLVLYRIDLDAAHEAAMRAPLLRRLNVFERSRT